MAGTLGGAALRGRMAAAFGSDRPAALIEDAAAILLGLLAVAGRGLTAQVKRVAPGRF